ncbi:hypothetical protein SmJEL517_g05736 [Synchytrium microbalum]|uniref:Autophagy-related protein 13 n=1 Tax=Synchytrium microbalum TaxID=1806994 RepID=A0A507BUV2_9FUNG|nr:uncharacterized protein SmJEL517_g05736 [Synchytrium microbalum]TPX30759.1 hypothetical protein SmJEL517_g05736 [Synchytrium microbalum]
MRSLEQEPDMEGRHPHHQRSNSEESLQMTWAHTQILEFVSKINHTVLRSRCALHTNLDGNVLDVEALNECTGFWQNSVPFNIDIFTAKRRLMERWVISFEQSTSDKKMSVSTDVTDLILLAQSLYSYVRLLPLQNAILEGNLSKSALQYCVSTADGRVLALSTNDAQESGSSGFDLSAKLKVFKFRSAKLDCGRLNLSVVYDSNLANFVIHKEVDKKEVERQQTQVTPTPPVPQQRRRMSIGGSPFPSPKMTRKVLALTHLKHDKSTDAKPTNIIINSKNSMQTPPGSPNSRARPVAIPSPSPIQSSASSPNDNADDLDADGVSISRGRHTVRDSADIASHSRKSGHGPLYLEVNHLPRPLQMAKSVSDGPPVNRRLSFGGPGHAELFGSLVGSYEESILSGRMSTLPSKPIMFIAEIGVVGFGKCKPSLQCPPHINVEFPAYFYEMYGDSAIATPYVGSIDLESAMAVIEGGQRSKTPGYRLPPKGQLQILIKNPSKTTVKVYLVPYDLRDMPPATKTFLRQKSYAMSSNSTTPVDASASSSSSKGSHSISKVSPAPSTTLPASPASSTVTSQSSTASTATPVTSTPSSTLSSSSQQLPPRVPTATSLIDKDRLRYAIHLQIISTPHKRILLSKSIRVVFSPRQPESDEKLRVVVENPGEPKYLTVDSTTTPDSTNRRHSHHSFSSLMAAGVSPSDYTVSPVRPSEFSSFLTQRYTNHHQNQQWDSNSWLDDSGSMNRNSILGGSSRLLSKQ